MAQTQIVHEDAALRVGVTRNLLVCAWTSTPEARHLKAVHRAIQTLAAKKRDGMATLDIVVVGSPRFTDEVRDELVRFLRDASLHGRGAAHVVEIGGLAGSAVRAFLSTAFLLARSTAPHKMFGELAPAAAWLLPLLSKGGEVWTTAEILAVAAEVKGKAPAPAPAR